MPVSMIHLPVARKVNPDASVAFYVGNLAADRKFHTFWDENTHMPYQEGKEFREKFMEENYEINSYVYHSTEWAYGVFKAMEDWDYKGFTETELVKINNVK